MTLILSNQQVRNENGQTIVTTVSGYTSDITEVVEKVESALVCVEIDGSSQSGFIYRVSDKTSYIVTTCTNVMRDSDIQIIFDSGYRIQGTLLGYDIDTNIALIETNTSFNTTTLQLGDSSSVKAGEYVIGISGTRQNGKASVSFGVTSRVGGERVHSDSSYASDYLEVDIRSNKYMMGGAIINLSGQVIGMITEAPVDGSDETSYAISINEIKRACRELRESGVVTRGTLPIYTRSISDLASYEKNQLNVALDQSNGVIVSGLIDTINNPFMLNDVIISIDNQTVTDTDGLKTIYYDHDAEDILNVEVIRDGETIQVSVVLQ